MSGFAVPEESVCRQLSIPTLSNRVDLGVRVELPAVIFSHLTDELYESKIVCKTEKFEDNVRTFCMNPYGIVVNENTNGSSPQRPQLRRCEYADGEHQLRPSGLQALFRAIPGQQRLWRKHCPAFQYAGRRRYRTEIRRSDAGT